MGIAIHINATRIATICTKLNDFATLQCETAKRALLAAMGGSCRHAEGQRPATEAIELGVEPAA